VIITHTFSDYGSPRDLGSFVLMSRIHPLNFITKYHECKFSLNTLTLIYWGKMVVLLACVHLLSLLIYSTSYFKASRLLSYLYFIKLLLGFAPSGRMKEGQGGEHMDLARPRGNEP
jgi:hypothetical protein